MMNFFEQNRIPENQTKIVVRQRRCGKTTELFKTMMRKADELGPDKFYVAVTFSSIAAKHMMKEFMDFATEGTNHDIKMKAVKSEMLVIIDGRFYFAFRSDEWFRSPRNKEKANRGEMRIFIDNADYLLSRLLGLGSDRIDAMTLTGISS